MDLDTMKHHWSVLHLGDGLPWPADSALAEGWRLYHEGEFEAAAQAGMALGAAGLGLANKASCIHAVYVETKEKLRFERLQAVADRTQRQLTLVPADATHWYWHGYALGRYSQGISVAKALARGLGGRVREALESTLRLAPDHVDAHLALARFHAETIDQVGELIGGMVHGARKDQGLAHYQAALTLAPESLIVQNEAAEGLWLLEGEAAQTRAGQLAEQVLRHRPLDAMEKLYLRTVQAALDT
jgi:hypothetical protein